MMKKRKVRLQKKQNISSNKLLFLSIALLFIIFEALFVMKNQASVLSNSLQQQVAGAHTQK